jgi:hypothetical protein
MQAIAPDGVEIPLDLTQLPVKSWVFITCLNIGEARQQLQLLAAMQGVEVRCKEAVFRGHLGIRVWRSR